MSIQHVYSQTVADGTATSVIRPSDWNSNHNQVLNMGGNTSGTAQISGQDIVWAGGNNVTLSANGSTVSIHGVAAQTNQTAASGNIAGAGYTFTTQAGTSIGATHNSAGLSLAQPLFLTGFTQTAQPVAVSAAGGSSAFSTLVIGTTGVAANGVTFTNSGGSVLMSHSLQQLSNTSAITANAVNTSVSGSFFQTSASSNLVAVSNSSLFKHTSAMSNYLQMGNSSQVFNGTNATVTMYSNDMSISAAAGGGGGTTNQTGPNIAVAGSTITSGTVLFSNSPTVTFGMAGSTITASAAGGAAATLASYWANSPFIAAQTCSYNSNTSYAVPLFIPYDVSFDRLRFLVSGVVPANTTVATSAAATTFGMTYQTGMYLGLYSNQTGASSLSMQNILSTSASMQYVLQASMTASQWSLSQGYSYLVNGTTSAFATATSVSTSNFSVSSAAVSNWAGARVMDVPWATSLAAGNYWLVVGMTQASTTQYSSGVGVCRPTFSNYGMSQSNLSFGLMGSATNLSVNPMWGLGSISSNTTGIHTMLNMQNISAIASNVMPFIQFIDR